MGAEAHRSSMSHSAKAANRIKQEAQGSQTEAGGGLSFLFFILAVNNSE